IYPADVADADTMFEAVLEAGADNVDSDDSSHEVICAPDDFNAVREALETAFGAPEESGLTWKPQNLIAVDEAQAATLLKLLDALDDNDDVQNVSSNFDISDDVIAKLT
ncbi:MAG: YebC/PmpR family DNA-binding transcriptional regulator, partial [Candidatus Puniceispirillaceae bacterium]